MRQATGTMPSMPRAGAPNRARPCATALLAFVAALCLTGAAAAQQGREPGTPWESGPYSFSDELGGFRITGVSGNGTKENPFVITQELESASPSTMVIRAVGRIRPYDYSGRFASGFLHMRVEIVNNSKVPWIEFEFELQEQRGRPSVFGDGLSFDQRRKDGGTIGSSSFAQYSRDFEPSDRLLFREGKVDHLSAASFQFFVTDFTPRWEFFLVQDPRIPFS